MTKVWDHIFDDLPESNVDLNRVKSNTLGSNLTVSLDQLSNTNVQVRARLWGQFEEVLLMHLKAWFLHGMLFVLGQNFLRSPLFLQVYDDFAQEITASKV